MHSPAFRLPAVVMMLLSKLFPWHFGVEEVNGRDLATISNTVLVYSLFQTTAPQWMVEMEERLSHFRLFMRLTRWLLRRLFM